MNRYTSVLLCAVTAISLVVTGSDSRAIVQYDANLAPTKSNTEFIGGVGIPSNRFAVNQIASGEVLGLKARARDTLQPISVLGNVYTVLAGLASDNFNPWWSFDFQFSPAPNGLSAEEYVLSLYVDFDPGVNRRDFAVLSARLDDGNNNPASFAWDETAGFVSNPGPGQWSNDQVAYSLSATLDLEDSFWSQPPYGRSFDPFAVGEYDIVLSVSRRNDVANPIGSLSIVVAVPEPFGAMVPMAMILTGIGTLSFLRRRN